MWRWLKKIFGGMWDKGYVKMGDGKCICDRVRSESMGLKCMEKNTSISSFSNSRGAVGNWEAKFDLLLYLED